MRIFQKFSQLLSPLIYLFMAPSFVFAADTTTTVNPCPSIAGFNTLCDITGSGFGPFIGNVTVALMVIASVIALGFLIYGGIKWIMSEGDKTAVEGARNTVIGAIIGLIVVFASYLILSLVLTAFGIDLKSGLKIPQVTVVSPKPT